MSIIFIESFKRKEKLISLIKTKQNITRIHSLFFPHVIYVRISILGRACTCPHCFAKLKSRLTASQSENTIDSISRHKGHAHFKLKIPLTASQGAKTTSIESHERHQARRLNANMSSTS